MKTKKAEIVETVKHKFEYLIYKGYGLVKPSGAQTIIQVYTEDEFNKHFGKRNNQYFKYVGPDTRRKAGATRHMVKDSFYQQYLIGQFGADNDWVCTKISECVKEINAGTVTLVTKHAAWDGYLWLDDEPLRRNFSHNVYYVKDSGIAILEAHPKVSYVTKSSMYDSYTTSSVSFGLKLSDYKWGQMRKYLKDKESDHNFRWKLEAWAKKSVGLTSEYVGTSYDSDDEDDDDYNECHCY